MATDWKALLNDRQYEAVSHGTGPLLILAGAGSGKTRVLTCRLSHLIESGVPAERILQLTFTNKAAEEMKSRAVEMLDDRCKDVMACTYHSFCSKMLHEYGPSAGLSKNMTILNIPDARSVINIVRYQLYQNFPNGYPKDADLANIFSTSVNKRISVAGVLETEPRMKKYGPYLDSIESIGVAYGKYKREHDLADYDDLIAMFKSLLEEHEDIRQEIEDRFDYIMVDEYQDTNPLQDDIVFLLRHNNPNLMVVGDDYQSIYAFRGSDVNNILSFPGKEPLVGTPEAGSIAPETDRDATGADGGAVLLTPAADESWMYDDPQEPAAAGVSDEEGMVYLDTNYRSSRQVIEFANAVMRKEAHFGFPKDMTATFDGGSKPRLVSVSDEAAEARYAVDELRRLHDEEGIPWGEMAVLSKTNVGNNRVSALMDEEGIPQVRFGGTSVLETDVVNNAIAYIRCAVNPHDRLGWHRLLSSLPTVGELHAEVVMDAMDDELAFIDRPAWQRCSGAEDLQRMRADILALRQMPLSEMVDLACQRAMEAQRAADDTDDVSDAQSALDPIIAEQARARREKESRGHLDKFKAMTARYDYPKELLDAIALQELGDDPGLPSDDELLGEEVTDAVTLSTIHSVKGLEFEAVIILDCVNGRFPNVRNEEFGGTEDMEELRCFYVAVTRAKRHLTMIAPGKARVYWSVRPTKQSHYLDGIGDDLLERVVV